MHQTSQSFDLKTIRARDTLPLRQQVLWPEKPVAHVMIENDAQALHIGAFLRGILVGVGSFYPNGKTARLRKLAVIQEMQGEGLGTQIVLFGAQKLRSDGVTTLWCDARVSALKFYQNLGFQSDSEVFEKSGVSYQKAALCLTALGSE